MDKTINYYDYGKGTPIVFLHGLALDSNSTKYLFEPILKDSNYRRIYIDLPGMGYSDPLNDMTSNNILNSLITLLNELLGNEKFIIYGHSYGGYLAQFLAIRFPKRVIKMFLTCPVITADSAKRSIGEHKNIIIDDIKDSDRTDNFNDYLSMNIKISNSTWQDYNRLIVPGLNKANFSCINDLKSHYTMNEEYQFKSSVIETPTFIMVGKNDNVVGYSEQLDMVRNVYVNGSIVLLNNAGHNIFIDELNYLKVLFKNYLSIKEETDNEKH